MRINLASVLVDDQEKALRFYTEVLGFKQKTDIPMGEHRWITVVSPDDPDGTELLLEPDAHPAAKPFKEALVADGIPFTAFAVDSVRAEFERLRGLGVRFTQEPTDLGPVTTAVLDDTCGNLIQIAAGDYGRARRHLRQPDPDRPPGRLGRALRSNFSRFEKLGLANVHFARVAENSHS